MDEEIAIRMEKEKRKQEALKRQIAFNLEQKKNQSAEILGNNHTMLELLNMELQNLRLEFLNEEISIGAKNLKESLADHKKYLCCNCCILLDIGEMTDSNCSHKELQEFLKIRNEQDFITKHKSLSQRYDRLNICELNCCHDYPNSFVESWKYWCSTSDNLCAFIIFGICIVYILVTILCFPFVLLYSAGDSLVNNCYKIGKRTQKIKQIYENYTQKIKVLDD